ncbi:MAG TPA: SH3 domain-containing protein [Blastocatellia bacterium]|nr:SH3 domain-containing protein [Blastocatellia bacterium]
MQYSRTFIKPVIVVCAVGLAALLLGACGFLSSDSKIDEGIVITTKENIRSSTAPAALPLAEVKRGDRLDILEQTQIKTPTRTAEWYKVRTKTKDVIEGWIEARYVISKSLVNKSQELYEKCQAIPSQGTGRLKVQTKLRIEPGGDVVTYLSRGMMVDIVGKTRTTIKPDKPQDADSEDTDEPETRTVIWYQVRLPESEVLRSGWVGAQQVQLDTPDEILYLEGEGRRFTGWVVFDQTKARKGEMKDNYIALMKNLSTEGPIDFTRLWILIYSPEQGRYISAPIDGKTVEDGLRGVLPITINANHRGFTIHELDENGKPVSAEYEAIRTDASHLRVRRLTPRLTYKKLPAKVKAKRR